MATIKNAKLIFPRNISTLSIHHLPSRNDKHFVKLKLDGITDCVYGIRGMYYGTDNILYMVLFFDHSSEQLNNCFDVAIIKAEFDNPQSLNVSMNFEGLSFNEATKFEFLTIPELPRWGDCILVKIANKIYSMSCKEVVIKDNNENPEIKVGSVNILDTEQEIFIQWVGKNAKWPN